MTNFGIIIPYTSKVARQVEGYAVRLNDEAVIKAGVGETIANGNESAELHLATWLDNESAIYSFRLLGL